MKKNFTPCLCLLGLIVLANSATAQVSYLFESFDAITSGSTTPMPGWSSNNLSSPKGTGTWNTGRVDYFPPQQGTGFIAANFQSGSETVSSTLSNWLFSPVLNLQNGYIVKFYARDLVSPNDYADRLQFRLSTAGASLDAGATATSVGVFSTLLVDINPTYTSTGFPGEWTLYSITLSGLPVGITQGRVAFRYFVEDGGGGANSNYIGVDNFLYSSNGILPVTFTNFSCQVNSDNSVQLQWQTSNEQNNAYFAVERSLDGVHFSDLAKVNSKKTNGVAAQYGFDDGTAGKVKGVNQLFYRLRQTDLDGNFKYSSIVTAKLKRAGNLNVVNVFTNSNGLSAKYNATKNGRVSISVINSFGQILTTTSQVAFEGLNTAILNTGILAKGIYFIKISDGNSIVTEQFLK